MSDTNKLSEALRQYAALMGIRVWVDLDLDTDATFLRLSKPSGRKKGERLEQKVILSPNLFEEIRPDILESILQNYVDKFADAKSPEDP